MNCSSGRKVRSNFFNARHATAGLRPANLAARISEADGQTYVCKLKLSGDNRFENQNKTEQAQ
jgi:hypothetical protein